MEAIKRTVSFLKRFKVLVFSGLNIVGSAAKQTNFPCPIRKQTPVVYLAHTV